MKKRIVSLFVSVSLALTGVVNVISAESADNNTAASDTATESGENSPVIQNETGTLILKSSVSADAPDGTIVFTVTAEDEITGDAECKIYSADEELIDTIKTALPAEIELAYDEYAEITLPVGDYSVVGDDKTDTLTTITDSKNVTVVRDESVSFTAKYGYEAPMGKIELSVDVKNDSSSEMPEDAVFTFVIDGDASGTVNVEIYGADENPADSFEKTLPATVKLDIGCYAIIEVPVGDYTVTQQASDAFSVTESVKVSVSKDKTVSAEFSNSYVEPVGILEIVNRVQYPDGFEAPDGETFYFEIDGETDVKTVPYAVLDENGATVDSGMTEFPVEIELAAGLNARFELPAGITYTVTQENNAEYTNTVLTRSIAVNKGQTASASFRNDYIEPMGTLEISVEVDYPDGPTKPVDDKFKFNIEGETYIDSASYIIYDSYGRKTDSGIISFPGYVSLSAGEYVHVTLPSGTSYTVTMDEDDDYEASMISDTVTVNKDDIADVCFENTYIEPMGTLEIGVDVTYPNGPETPVNDVFVFTVSGETYKKTVSYSVYDANGDKSFTGKLSLPAVISLKNGEYAHIELPASTAYTVTLDKNDDYLMTVYSKTLTVRKNKTADVLFDGEYIEPIGILKLGITLIEPSDASAPNDTFKFTVSGETYRTEVNYTVYKTDGSKIGSYVGDFPLQLELTASQYAEIELTPGNYTVTQTKIENYEITKTLGVDITKRRESEASVTNRYIEPLGKLVIERNKLGENESFVFDVKGMDSANRHISFTVILPVGKSNVTVCDVPMGNYSVTLSSDWSVHYLVEISEGVLTGDTTVEANLSKNGDIASAPFKLVYGEKVYWVIGEAYIDKKYLNY